MVRPDPVFGPGARLTMVRPDPVFGLRLGRQTDAAKLGLLPTETSFRKLKGQAAP